MSEVNTYFDQQLDYVVPGLVGELSNPTPIKNLKTGKILRSG
jgi:L-threonylcarbamoyladenylate synthase